MTGCSTSLACCATTTPPSRPSNGCATCSQNSGRSAAPGSASAAWTARAVPPGRAQLTAEGPQRLAPLTVGQPVEEQVPVEMVDLVLQAPGQHPGPLDHDRLAVQVDPGGDRVPGPRGGEVEAGGREGAPQ